MKILQSSYVKGSLLLGARLLLAVFLLKTAYDKSMAYAFFEKYISANGLPAMLLPFDIAFNVVAGLAILAGYRTSIVALSLVGYVAFATLIFHMKLSEQVQYLFFMKNIGILAGLLALTAAGGGQYALDARTSANVPKA